jgi:hypothetical protein
MTQQPQRRPGDKNPELDPNDPAHMVEWTDHGGLRRIGRQDHGIARAIFAVLDWRKRRRAMKNR